MARKRRLSEAYKSKPCEVCSVTGKYYAKGKCNSCYTKARLADKPDVAARYKRNGKDKALQKSYGITLDLYEKMYDNQGGRCGICEELFEDTANHGNHFSVDHDHKTGLVRALLCTNCNFGIGHFKEDETRLSSALMYLRRFRNGI